MNYKETVEDLYNRTPQFQSIGAAAYKPGLDTIKRLDAAFGNPHKDYKIIHVAGTNGKGSTSHTLAAVLQAAGYKVGLYTSPHLVDFRERIRCNGKMISEQGVIDFMERYRSMDESRVLEPSFFELTTIMAFEWFSRQKVDVAVIEVGLGGRLDSTNIIDPTLSVITNISFDHMAQLGNTLESIAHEKAGIMRRNVPVVCGEPSADLQKVFVAEAEAHGTAIRFSMNENVCESIDYSVDSMTVNNTRFGDLHYQLTGECQRENARTVLVAINELIKLGFEIPNSAVSEGFAHVCDMTGLLGRWMKLSDNPFVICDTGHNIGGWRFLSHQLEVLPRPLIVMLGFVNDKDITPILPLLPADAEYIFTNADIPRALPAEKLKEAALAQGLHGEIVNGVGAAYEYGCKKLLSSGGAGAMFIGGSTFVIADLLKYMQDNCEKFSNFAH